MADRAPCAFVCGHPIAHSRSPVIHRYWLDKYGLNGSYEPVDIAPDAFPRFLNTLGENGYVGGNITIPHKENAFALCFRRDEAAEAIGAVNTIWLENGQLAGSNTDAIGFERNLDDHAPGWADGRPAVVLGAGGAARAIIYSLQKRGARAIHVVNRTVERAEALALKFGSPVSAHGWKDLPGLLPEAGILVNTTSLGMDGSAGPEIDFSRADKHLVVTDIVYVPLETPLLASARSHGLVTVDGLGMLLHQAAPGFERWFGIRPEVTEELRATVLATMEHAL